MDYNEQIPTNFNQDDRAIVITPGGIEWFPGYPYPPYPYQPYPPYPYPPYPMPLPFPGPRPPFPGSHL